MARNPHTLRFHRHEHLHGAFGAGWYGAFAEKVARFLGTPVFLTVQTSLLLTWIILNGVLPHSQTWDLYPFILLNLCLSFQAAYAAPLILVAENRQAERDRVSEIADAKHREALHDELKELLLANTELTRHVHTLTIELRDHIEQTT